MPTYLRTAISLLLLLVLCTSCQAVGAIAGKAIGTPPIPAKFVPKKVDTLVLAEHRVRANVDDSATEDMSRRVSLVWEREKITPIVDPIGLEQLRATSQPTFDAMSIDAIGKRLHASQILYLDILDDQIEAPPASDLIRGKMSVRVRIIDVATGATLWPTDASDGYPIDSQSDWVSRGDGTNDSTVEESVRNQTAELIARLFYKFTPAD